MKKRLFAVLLAVLIVASLCAVTAFADGTEESTEDGFSYEHPFTSPSDYKNAIEDNYSKYEDEDVYLVVRGQNYTEGQFNLGNVQSKVSPPKLHLFIYDCTFTGNTSGDNAKPTANTSFMYLPNCVELVISGCTFNSSADNSESSPLMYGINWNLIQVTGAKVSITGSTFNGYYTKNAIKLNQRNGADDTATDVKVNGGTTKPASIEKAEIINCTFSENAAIAIGSQGKYTTEKLASPSTGMFPLTIERCTGTNSDGSVTVRLDYLMAENAEEVTRTVNDNTPYEQTKESIIQALAEDYNYVAMVGDAPFETLQEAINAAGDEGVVELIDDVILTNVSANAITIPKDAKITIEGNEFTINAHYYDASASGHPGSRDDRAILTLSDGSDLTLNNVVLNFSSAQYIDEGYYSGDGVKMGYGSNITFGKDTIANFDGLYRAFIHYDNASTDYNKVVIDGAEVHISNITANASNGGDWTVKNGSELTYNTIGNHASSTESLTVEDSTVRVEGSGLLGIISNKISLTDSYVTVQNCAIDKDALTQYGYTGQGAVTLKGENATLKVDDSSLILGANGNGEETDKDLLLGTGTLETEGNYTLVANILTEEGSTEYNSITYVSDGWIHTEKQTSDGTHTVISDTMTKSGYEFRGWRYDGKLYKAGDKITGITSDITLTAVWDAIDIPDTYPIEIADAANGEVSTSLTNASRGSVITVTVDPDEGYELGSLTVTGPDGRVDVKRVNATTYTFVMPNGEVTVRAAFVVEGLPFTDVSANQWFYEAVSYVYTNGMMEGDSATTFNPDGGMTRAMFWAVLARIDGETVTGSNWVELARAWAMESGTSDGTDPNGLVTREMMVTMLYRFAGSPAVTGSLSGYTDAASVSDWAEDAMVWAIDEGVISGVTAATLAPQGTATRAQCATILMRYAESVA